VRYYDYIQHQPMVLTALNKPDQKVVKVINFDLPTVSISCDWLITYLKIKIFNRLNTLKKKKYYMYFFYKYWERWTKESEGWLRLG
jgi:hypothetical protein